jgi:hypothetical protein
MALIKNKADFEKYILIAGTVSEETLLKGVADAQEKYIRDVLGDGLLSSIDAWYNSLTPATNVAYTNLLPYIQRALARFAIYISSPELDVKLTDSGIGVISNQNIAPASADRVKKFDQSNEQRGWDNVETLIRFLEANKTDYALWANSSAYTLSISNLVNSALEYDSIIKIDKSRLYFQNIRPILTDIELLKIKPTISSDLFDVILAQLKANSVSAANNKILPLLQRAECYFAAAESLDKGKYQGTGVEINKMFMDRDISTYQNKAEAFLAEARRIIDASPDDYPEYRDSDIFIGLTEDGKTQYPRFDNTTSGNKIFVM